MRCPPLATSTATQTSHPPLLSVASSRHPRITLTLKICIHRGFFYSASSLVLDLHVQQYTLLHRPSRLYANNRLSFAPPSLLSCVCTKSQQPDTRIRDPEVRRRTRPKQLDVRHEGSLLRGSGRASRKDRVVLNASLTSPQLFSGDDQVPLEARGKSVYSYISIKLYLTHVPRAIHSVVRLKNCFVHAHLAAF